MHLKFECLSAAEKDALHQRVLHVLEHVGIGVESTVALDLLAAAGAGVDRERRTATLPPELVESCLEKAPGSVRLAARDPEHDLLVGAGSPLACCTDGMVMTVLDDATGTVRDATRDDLAYFYGLFDALDDLDFIWTSVTLGELDALTVGLETDLTSPWSPPPSTCRASWRTRQGRCRPFWRCWRRSRGRRCTSGRSTLRCTAPCRRCGSRARSSMPRSSRAPRGTDPRPPPAADGHHGSFERLGHDGHHARGDPRRRHRLPAGGAGLPSHGRRHRRLHASAHRRVSQRHARGRADRHGRPGHDPAVRIAEHERRQ